VGDTLSEEVCEYASPTKKKKRSKDESSSPQVLGGIFAAKFI
jgi:hypothetical protein